jgi:hypothetical protein
MTCGVRRSCCSGVPVYACVVPLLAVTASDAAVAVAVRVHVGESSDHIHLSILMLWPVVCVSLFVLFCSHLACVM